MCGRGEVAVGWRGQGTLRRCCNRQKLLVEINIVEVVKATLGKTGKQVRTISMNREGMAASKLLEPARTKVYRAPPER